MPPVVYKVPCIVFYDHAQIWNSNLNLMYVMQDPDDSLKRKTFELLYKMTMSSNVEVIVDRMIDYMISISDDHYKTYIASRCVELAEQFAPSNHWFIQVRNSCLILHFFTFIH